MEHIQRQDFKVDLIDDDTKVVQPLPEVLYQTMYNECRGCGKAELTAVCNSVINRMNHCDFSSNMQCVLLQKGQYATKRSNPPCRFKIKIDSIFNQPVQYNFLYFANMKTVRRNVRLGITRYRVLKWLNDKKNKYRIGSHHFFNV